MKAHCPERIAWNPRYLAYCKAHGHATPEAALAADDLHWPGGRMCGFMLWMSEQWAAFTTVHPHNIHIRHQAIQDAFDEWLKGIV